MSKQLNARQLALKIGLADKSCLWRQLLDSPLDSSRCAALIASLATELVPPEDENQRDARALVPHAPFPLHPIVKMERLPPKKALRDFASNYLPNITSAAMSLLTSPYAWGINGRPLLSLLLEVSYQPDWSTFVTEDKDGKKLLGTLERSLIRLLGDGSIFEATLVRGNGLFSIVASLQLILSVLLNTLAAYPALPPRSPQSVAHTTRCFSTTLSRVSADLATLYGQHPSVIRSPEEGWTDLGKNLSVIWTDLNVVFAILVDGTTEKARSLKEAREVKSRWRSRKYLIAPLAKLQELEGERQAIMV